MMRYYSKWPTRFRDWLRFFEINVMMHGTSWRHQMETFSALLALCAGNSPVPGEFPSQRPVTRSFDVFFDLRLNKRLSKQSKRWWFKTLSSSLWRHCNDAQLQKLTNILKADPTMKQWYALYFYILIYAIGSACCIYKHMGGGGGGGGGGIEKCLWRYAKEVLR